MKNDRYECFHTHPDYYYTIECWEEEKGSAYLRIWMCAPFQWDRMIRTVICNGLYSALSEAQHWIDETIELRMVAKAAGQGWNDNF